MTVTPGLPSTELILELARLRESPALILCCPGLASGQGHFPGVSLRQSEPKGFARTPTASLEDTPAPRREGEEEPNTGGKRQGDLPDVWSGPREAPAWSVHRELGWPRKLDLAPSHWSWDHGGATPPFLTLPNRSALSCPPASSPTRLASRGYCGATPETWCRASRFPRSHDSHVGAAHS